MGRWGCKRNGEGQVVANGSDRMTNIFRAVALAASVVMRTRAEGKCMVDGWVLGGNTCVGGGR